MKADSLISLRRVSSSFTFPSFPSFHSTILGPRMDLVGWYTVLLHCATPWYLAGGRTRHLTRSLPSLSSSFFRFRRVSLSLTLPFILLHEWAVIIARSCRGGRSAGPAKVRRVFFSTSRVLRLFARARFASLRIFFAWT